MSKVKEYYLGEQEFNDAMDDIYSSIDNDNRILKERIKELEEENAVLQQRLDELINNYSNGRN